MEKFNDKKNRNLDFLRFIGPYVSDTNFEYIKSCGSWLEFYADETVEKKKLKYANFCHNRFCPFCNWRKARRRALELSVILKYLKSENYEFVFLTLTAPNVDGEHLEEEIKKYSSAFKRLMMRTEVKKAVKGYARKLEITYSKRRRDFHPHYHVILAVRASYFTDSRIYITRDRWLKLWQESTKDPSITQVDVRRMKTDDSKAIAEASKYSAKDSDYLISKQVFDYFYKSLKGKRDISESGVFKEARQLYKAGKLDYLKERDLTEYVYILTYIWGPKEYSLFENDLYTRRLTEEEKQQINNLYESEPDEKLSNLLDEN
jgi:plasmid rolling circle replication initiator protein Rep